jgi:hypothetical protein
VKFFIGGWNLIRPKAFRRSRSVAGGSHMQGYRAYLVGRDGHIKDRVEFWCRSDSEALQRARSISRLLKDAESIVELQAVEVWQEDRRVVRLGADGSPGEK